MNLYSRDRFNDLTIFQDEAEFEGALRLLSGQDQQASQAPALPEAA
jgi:hypothetical protein